MVHIDLSTNSLGGKRLLYGDNDDTSSGEREAAQAYKDSQDLHKAIQHAIYASHIEVIDLSNNPLTAVPTARSLLAGLTAPTLRQSCMAASIEVRLQQATPPTTCADGVDMAPRGAP